jgi:hypothetical protein
MLATHGFARSSSRLDQDVSATSLEQRRPVYIDFVRRRLLQARYLMTILLSTVGAEPELSGSVSHRKPKESTQKSLKTNNSTSRLDLKRVFGYLFTKKCCPNYSTRRDDPEAFRRPWLRYLFVKNFGSYLRCTPVTTRLLQMRKSLIFFRAAKYDQASGK